MCDLTLTDADRSLIDLAYQLAHMRLAAPVAPGKCDVCADIGQPCIAHRGPNDWPQPKERQP